MLAVTVKKTWIGNVGVIYNGKGEHLKIVHQESPVVVGARDDSEKISV